MFIDTAKIHIKAGDGGNGVVSFHRERHVPDGGPDGGDGGNGGNVIFIVNSNMMTLMDYRYKARLHAQNGQNGRGANMTGKTGEDLCLEVPPGTLIKDAETGEVLVDLTVHNQKAVLANGGRGGKGNARFSTSTRRAPKFAQMGEKGEERSLILELKSIADVGLVGFPNVGKSTMLSVLTSAHPKIADYPFTTLSPNLGVVKWHERSFVLADIPGLIEGAHEGAGLGHDFLRHIERTRMLVHVVDASGIEGRDPVQDYHKINFELNSFSKKLSKLPQVVAANKSDLPGSYDNFERLKAELEPEGVAVVVVSAATNNGFDELLNKIFAILDQMPVAEETSDTPMELNVSIKYSLNTFEVKREGHMYIVSGPAVDKLMRSVNLDDRESLGFFQKMCKQRGIIDELKRKGIVQGDTVRIGGVEFEYSE
jgi:GTP-binding protein